jgi:hypothetical protein
MSTKRTRHIKVYIGLNGSYLNYLAWDEHTDNYAWASNGTTARLIVEERNAGKRLPCKLDSTRSISRSMVRVI